MVSRPGIAMRPAATSSSEPGSRATTSGPTPRPSAAPLRSSRYRSPAAAAAPKLSFESSSSAAAGAPVQLLDVEQHRLDLERRGDEPVHERMECERVVRAGSEAEAQLHERPKNHFSSGFSSSSRVNGRTRSSWPSRSETVKSSSSVSFASCSASPSS